MSSPQQAPVSPTLPQNDTPAGRAALAAQLEQACATYQWTEAVPTLPGVPVVATLPAAEEPTLEWWLKLLPILIAIVRNQIAVDEYWLAQGLAGLDPLQVAADKALVAGAETEAASIAAKMTHNPPTRAGIIADIEEGVEILLLDGAVAALKNHAASLRDAIERHNALAEVTGSPDPRTLDTYRDIFRTIDCPPIGWTFEDDLTFAHLRVAGPNSVLIAAVSAVPPACPLTPAQYAAVVAGDTLDAALADGRLFQCDYADLAIIDPGSWQGHSKYLTCPVALFAVPPGTGTLVPVAIRCDPADPACPVATPGLSPEMLFAWQLAKYCVQVADGNYHELFVHLARTHLVTEAVAVATHRHLASQHPVWALLVRHFEGTMFINEVAATSLITPNGPIDHIFAGKISSSQHAAASARLSFDFTAGMLPNDLARRGVTGASAIADYPWRDDALLVWKAIERWVSDYVGVYYADDSAVTGDTELAAWAADIAGPGQVRGFAAPQTRADLVAACTMIIFTASAQHASVNFPQRTVMEFAPSVTGAMWQPPSVSPDTVTKRDWLAAMPPQQLALEQLTVLHLLGSLYYRPLGSYLSPDFPYPAWFRDPAIVGKGGPLAMFQTNLQQVEAQIVERNQSRQRPYDFLLPSLIPSSTNI